MVSTLLLNITALTAAKKAIAKAIEHIDEPPKARRYLRKVQRALKELVGVANVCGEASASEGEEP